MSKYHKAETIPERGNVLCIERVHFRELDREWGEMSPALHALIRWLRNPENQAEDISLKFGLNQDQHELFLSLIQAQLRFAVNARKTQICKRYGGFKKAFQYLKNCRPDLQGIPEPTMAEWEAVKMPDALEYATMQTDAGF